MADPQPIQVTNNTSALIELFDAYQTSTSDAGPTAITPVTYTSLGTVKPGVTGTIKTLHASNHIVAMQSGPLSDPTGGTQADFPVKIIAVLSITKNRSFTVEKADKDAMEQTFRFIRYASANPGSAIATQFLAALNDDDQTTAVNAFFAASTSFGSCTMITWAAVTAWQSDFLSAWQGSYYLYDATPDLQVMRLVAGASVTLNGDDVEGQLWLADANGNWTSSSQHVALSIAGGTVTESVLTEGMSVTLQPVWMNALQTSGTDNSTVTSVIAPVMAGTVNGTKVLGNFNKLAIPTAGTTESSDSITAWLKQNLNVSILLSAGMLFIMYKQWQESKNTKADEVVRQDQAKGDNDTTIQNDVNKSNSTVEVGTKEAMAPVQEASRIPFAEFPANEKVAIELMRKATVELQIANQQAKLDEILEQAPASPETDAVANSLQDAIDKAGAGDIDGAWRSLSDVSTNLKTLTTKYSKEFSTEEKQTSEEVQKDITEANKQAEAERETADKQADDSNKNSDDRVDPEDVNRETPPEMEFPL